MHNALVCAALLHTTFHDVLWDTVSLSYIVYHNLDNFHYTFGHHYQIAGSLYNESEVVSDYGHAQCVTAQPDCSTFKHVI